MILTLIEAGRYEYCGANLEIITNSAVESAMGDYADELLEKYGLFLNTNGDEVVNSKVMDYVGTNVNGGAVDGCIDLLSVKDYQENDFNVDHITDGGGSFMAKEVTNYMKVKLGEDVAEKLIDKYGGSSSIGNISSFIKSVKSAKKKLERIADAAADLYDSYENIKKTAKGIKKDIKGIDKAIKNIRETIEEYKNGECEFEDLNKAYNILVGQVDNLKDDIKNISEYFEKATNSKGDYEEGKEESKDIYKEVMPNVDMEEEEDELLDKYQDVKDIIEVIDGVDLSDFDKTKKLAEENAVKIIERRLDKLLENIEVVGTVEDMAKNIALNKISENPDKSIGKTNGYGVSGKDIIRYVENIAEDAMLGQVVELSKVSNLKITKGNDLPSEIKDKGKGKINLIDEALFSAYCADTFGSFINKKEDLPMNYELEYILCGYDNDKENLSGTVAKLLALREATNIITILSSPRIWPVIAAWAIPAVAVLGEILIVAAWGYAESVMDVRTLLANGRCKLVKKSTDFKLSLYNIGSIINGKYGGENNTGESILDGLNYTEFCEVLLYITPKISKYYRAMDVIQIREQNKNNSFKMRDCIVGIKVDIDYDLNPLFISKKNTRKFMEGGIVKIHREAKYSY